MNPIIAILLLMAGAAIGAFLLSVAVLGKWVCSGLNEPGSVMSYCPNAWKNLYFHPQTLDTMKNNVKDIDLKYK